MSKSVEKTFSRRRGDRRLYSGTVITPDGEVVTRNDLDARFEYPSPIPIEIPVGLRMPESTDQRIKRLMNEERAWQIYSRRQEERREDMDDFEYEDDPMFISEYEQLEDPVIIDDKTRRRFDKRLRKVGFEPQPLEEDLPATPPADKVEDRTPAPSKAKGSRAQNAGDPEA